MIINLQNFQDIKCSKAFRFASDSPRETLQAHSRRMADEKPSSSNGLKDESAY
jgi:hypothetical protein